MHKLMFVYIIVVHDKRGCDFYSIINNRIRAQSSYRC